MSFSRPANETSKSRWSFYLTHPLRLFHIGMVTTALTLACGGVLAQSPPKAPALTAIDNEPHRLIHDFTGLPLDENGWTDFQAVIASGYEDARVVFVSESLGDDATGLVYGVSDLSFDQNGMFQPNKQIKPFKTILAANSEMRAGYPDVLLLKRGDEWTNERWSTGDGGRAPAGRSSEERHIIASYGSGKRPRLRNDSGVSFDNDDTSFIIISGLHFFANDWLVADRAIDIRGTSSHILVEDIKVDNQVNIIQGGSLQNIVIRRSIFIGGQAHDGQFYAAATDKLLFEENVFSEPFQRTYPDQSRFGRFLYLNPGDYTGPSRLPNLVLRGNIFFRGERESADFRAGGRIENNLFLQVDRLIVGGRGGSGNSIQSAEIVRNVFTQGTPNTNGSNLIQMINIDGGQIVGNVWTDPRGIGEFLGVYIAGTEQTYIARNIEIAENIMYGFRSATNQPTYGVFISSALTDVANLVVRDNEFQFVSGATDIIFYQGWVEGDARLSGFSYSGNNYYSTSSSGLFTPGDTLAGWITKSGEVGATFAQQAYPDAGRTVETYMSSLGLSGDAGAFVLRALGQSRSNWQTRFTANAFNSYVREGFGVSN
ncbi:hypothetical protein [Thioalkalivibrio sp. XN279]|uniref:hypothetical protein n=1 Tax=Thioalkalivibrio sp. XN279 TaxID=2714953 RepID=UPI001408ECDB|nr:hypothetical protein [Thioalkalivibrio sp. XN279]NHA15366.1 hypothetical protein [Thioalkalivibrio sp. XN279]